MSGVAPFTGLNGGTASAGNNPMVSQLRRIGSFRQGQAARQSHVAEVMAVNEHTAGLQKDMITHASREERRNQTHAAKVKAGLVDSLRTSGVDAAAPGRTRVEYEGLKVETVRPVTKAKKAKKSAGAPAPGAVPPANFQPPKPPLTPKFQSP